MFISRQGFIYAGNPPPTGWNLATASYDSKSKSVSAQDTAPRGIYMKDDGTKLYVAGDTNNTVYQYTLSTAYDITTASYDSKSRTVGTQDSNPNDVFFSSDGTKMYIAGNTNDIIYQYTLSTAWDLSTATYANKSKDVSGIMTNLFGLFFKPDGTKMYICGAGIADFTLSTAWDVSTATLSSEKSTTAQDSSPRQIWFKSDGTRMFMLGGITDDIFQYNLSTAWLVSSASYSNVSYSLNSIIDEGFEGLTFNQYGTKMYAVGVDTDTIYQFSLTS
jgi:hypothetical protein